MSNAIPPAPTARNGRIVFFLSCTAIAMALVRSISLQWICDDIFITFRYIANWITGVGIVFNPGERVEGYTHPLWMFILAGAHALGFDLVDASMGLGIASYVLTVAMLAFIAYQRRTNASWVVPFAALALSLNYDAAVWATSGLETSFAMMLLVAAFTVWFFVDAPESRRLLITGALLVLAPLARPDAALLLIGAEIMLVVREVRRHTPVKSAVQTLLQFNLAMVVIAVPFLAWKVSYYGDLLPLTFYAKSGSSTYFDQGFFYITLFFKAYWSAALFLFGVPFLIIRLRRAAPAYTDDRAPGGRLMPMAVAVGGIIVYLLLAVARVGGDFMFARFIIPMLPFMYFVIGDLITAALPARRAQLAVAALLLASVIYENTYRDDVLYVRDGEVLKPRVTLDPAVDPTFGEDRGIVDERRFYYTPVLFRSNGAPVNTIELYTEAGRWMHRVFQGLGVGVCLQGGQNIEAYYAGFVPAIITYGLTDRYIASLPLSGRGRIGHERSAPLSYLAQRHVVWQLREFVNQPPMPHAFNECYIAVPDLGWQRMEITYYDRELFAEMRKRLAAEHNPSMITDYDAFVPYFADSLAPKMKPEEVRGTYENLQRTYFSHYPDSLNQAKIRAHM